MARVGEIALPRIPRKIRRPGDCPMPGRPLVFPSLRRARSGKSKEGGALEPRRARPPGVSLPPFPVCLRHRRCRRTRPPRWTFPLVLRAQGCAGRSAWAGPSPWDVLGVGGFGRSVEGGRVDGVASVVVGLDPPELAEEVVDFLDRTG